MAQVDRRLSVWQGLVVAVALFGVFYVLALALIVALSAA